MNIRERARELYKEYLSEIYDMSDMVDTSALMTLCVIEAFKEKQQSELLERAKKIAEGWRKR